VQRLQGVDSSAKMIELANQKLRDYPVHNIIFTQTDLFDQRLESHSFSAIIAFNIFHLLDDPSKVFAQLHDLLTEEGLLISQTPCLHHRSFFFRSMISLAQKIKLAPKITSFTVEEMESFVSHSDFEILETKMWEKKNAVQWIVAKKIKQATNRVS